MLSLLLFSIVLFRVLIVAFTFLLDKPRSDVSSLILVPGKNAFMFVVQRVLAFPILVDLHSLCQLMLSCFRRRRKKNSEKLPLPQTVVQLAFLRSITSVVLFFRDPTIVLSRLFDCRKHAQAKRIVAIRAFVLVNVLLYPRFINQTRTLSELSSDSLTLTKKENIEKQGFYGS